MSTTTISSALPVANQRRAEPAITPAATLEPLWIRVTLTLIAFAFLTLFLFVPLAAVFAEALKKAGRCIWKPSSNRMLYRRLN
jgi:sulfate transport system permease protein